MDYIALGKSNLLVSATAFGAMSLDETEGEEATASLLKQAYEGGVNFFDTSRRSPESERRLGEAIKGNRKNVFLATKSAAKNADQLEFDLKASMEALMTDYIDLYQLEPEVGYLPDLNTDDGLVRKLLELKKEGLIRHFGIATESFEIARSMLYSKVPWETVQYPFNMLCSSEVENLVADFHKADIGFIAMRPLCGGILTNIPLALGYFTQFDNVVPVWGVTNEEQMQQILYFTDNPPVIDEQFKHESERVREFFN